MQTKASAPEPLSDIRTWSLLERRGKLAKGTRIQVSAYKGSNVVDMPLPLLHACSTKMVARIENNKITLPSNVEGRVAANLLHHLRDLTSNGTTTPMALSFNHVDNLKMCGVAEVLGLSMYVQHIIEHYTNMARSNELSYNLIDFISKMKGDVGKKLFNEVARTQGIASFEGHVNDKKAFIAYLATNSRLHEAITSVHVEQQRISEEMTKAREDYMLREACRQSKQLMTPEEKEEARSKKVNWKETQIRLKEKERKETELVAVVREKRKRGWKNWSAEEASVLEKYFGKRVSVQT
ncbi:hypothetical protein HBI56_191760 [Parastagonospora nodorum]|uniref:Uncharacterized protein n=1 Tax=Phaeosphaeria nodorum (strain SN15 / ATCC MYA-4574 / FGSC 10173) TaxID=321614 RepID=A0A7U2NPZ0_PHANO|nr:hypothetical protein HBH56_178580 [Parastagonospora nodorum]QRD06167.1 hypothetical protein JI435_445400 [Parastagonospora nodorum SN15]KAH3932122.1 hypothetical protein HBH54_091240 [Parastagonospora nodorum]KAH3996147.1 hypothetical protein HBI10_161420 [Parastagonospora nodorum]KAH4019515.1 hypothetical protein HBI13_125780 [Parastagonospora nodorum]